MNSNIKTLTILLNFLLIVAKGYAEETITPEKASETVLAFLCIRSQATLARIEVWLDATLSEPVPYYDFFDNKIAYCYTVSNKKETIGYIILSLSQTEHPIQEFSTSAPPHKRTLTICKSEAKKYLLANKLSGDLGQPSFIYVCPSIYFAQFPLLDKSKQETKSIFVEMRSATVVDNLKSLREPGFIGHRKRNPYWSSIASKSSGKDDDSFSYIEHIPVYDFFISSHATAAAMVLGYWNLKRPKEPDKSFIGEITNYIKTCGCGKKEEVLEMARGIKGFLALRGYKTKARERCKRSTISNEQITFEEYQQEIDAGRPMVVSFMHKNNCARDIASAKKCDIQTCVAGVGYLSDTTGKYIIAHEGFFVKETTSGEIHSGSHWSNPGVTFYNWDSISSNMILTTATKPEKF